MRPTNTRDRLLGLLTVAALTPLTVAAGTPTPACAAPTVMPIGTAAGSAAAEVVDLRDRLLQTAYLHLGDAGLAVQDVHGSWSTTEPGKEGVAGLAPFDGQTRTATTTDPVVLEGEWIGELHSFVLDLYTHLPQQEDLPDADLLGITVTIDGRTLLDNDVQTIQRSSPFDCHRLYYGWHRVGFDGLAEAMASEGLDGPDGHRLRLEIRPASSAAHSLPLVFATHRTPSAIRLNDARRGIPMHTVG